MLALRKLEELGNRSEPFFLKVSFHRPHSPYDPPARLLNAMPTQGIPPVSLATDGWDAPFRKCQALGRKDAWCGEVGAAELLLSRRAYLASLAFVDEQIGLIMQALKKSGALEKTFVLYTSDHGDMQQDHYLWRKGYPYEGSAHVPLFIRWPEVMDKEIDIARGSKVDAVTELRDILPTFLDVAGQWSTKWEGQVDGRPLTTFLGKRPSAWREWVDLGNDMGETKKFHWNGGVDREMKFIFSAGDKTSQLFNLTADPQEKLNLAALPEYAQEVAKWRRRLVQQFTAEGRGHRWVKNGQLQKRPKTCIYGPNYPQAVHNCQLVSEQQIPAEIVL